GCSGSDLRAPLGRQRKKPQNTAMTLNGVIHFFGELIPRLTSDRQAKARFMLDGLMRRHAESGERGRRFFTDENHGLDAQQSAALDESLKDAREPEVAKLEVFNDALLTHVFGVPGWRLGGVRQGLMQVLAEEEFGAEGPVDDQHFFDVAKGHFQKHASDHEVM